MARLTLEPFGEQHVAGLTPMLDDPDVLRFTRFPVPMPDDFAREWLATYEKGRADGSKELFAAIGEDGELVGVALAGHIDVVGQESELGYLVAPAARGRGLATEMLRELTRWAFEERGLLRVALIIDVDNEPSVTVARRCGYVHEGTLRSTFVKTGAPRVDVEVWSRLPTDPPG